MADGDNDPGISYKLDENGNPVDSDSTGSAYYYNSDSDDDDHNDGGGREYVDSLVLPQAAAPVDAIGFWPDGSRQWRFVPAADPRQWSDLTYIDQHMDEVTALGWIAYNEQSAFWTVDEAIAAYEVYIEAATAAYRADDIPDEAYGVDVEASYNPPAQPQAAQPEPAIPAAPPPPPAGAPPAPDAPQWERPADRIDGGTQYGNVMDELRRRNPENDGRWTATEAASFDRDSAFLDEQGITAAQDRAYEAAAGAYAADGSVSAESYNALTDANADVARAQIRTDTTQNRYQQSTDFQPATSAEEQLQQLDASVRDTREQVARDPQAAGLGMTPDERDAYFNAQARRVDAEDFQRLTNEPGRQPGSTVIIDGQPYVVDENGRIPQDYGRLQDLRDAEQREYAEQAASDPSYREWQAEAERRQAQAMTEQERVEASRIAAEARMGRNA